MKELQSQEFSDGTGLEEYDYGARMQDSRIGRWMTLDPSADKYYSISPYAYVDNNPINNKDVDGRDIIVTRLHQVYATNEEAKAVLHSSTDVLRFPPKTVHDFGVTGLQGGPTGGITYSKNKKTGKYDVQVTVVEFVNQGLSPGGMIDEKNKDLSKEVAAHEEGHGDQYEEAFNSNISVSSGITEKKGDKTNEIKFSGKIDEILNQASGAYDKLKNENPSAVEKITKEDYVKGIFSASVITVLKGMLKDDAAEKDANKRASKKLSGGMPYTNGQRSINL